MTQKLLSLLRFRRSAICQPLAAVLAVLLLPSFSWLESTAGIPLGPSARSFQASAQTIHHCGESRGNLIIQQVCVNGSPAPVDDLDQLESDAVSAYLAAHSLPASDAALIYSEGRADLRDAIRGSMLAILLGIIKKDPSTRTTHEKALYNWLQFAVQQNEIAEYTAALAEYQKFLNNPCRFKLDPDVASQYGLSYDGTFLCLPQTVAAAGPPTVPDAGYFTAVGLKNSYGKPAQTTPTFAALVTDTQINLGEMYGIALGAGAVLSAATGASIGAFFTSIFPFALGATSPELAVFWGGVTVASALEIGAVAAGPAGIVLLCVITGVIAGFQVFNNQDQINQLNNLTNLVTQAQNNAPDLNSFVSDTTGLGLFKLNETLVAQTLPDVPSMAALPAHGANDPLFLVTASSDRTNTTANSFVYQDWNGIGWQTTTVGGWFAQICLGDSAGNKLKCFQPNSLTASIHYVDWTGTNRIASRLGSNFTITKAAPASDDKPCPADSTTGLTPGTDFSHCSSYVASQIQYDYQESQYTMSLSQPPMFTTSSSTIYFTYGQQETANITASGAPAPAIIPASLFPPGVSFGGSTGGTASLAYNGTGTPGTYVAELLAENGQGVVTKYFNVVIATQLQITSPNTLTGYTGLPVNFLVTTTGYPTPHLSIDPRILPDGLSFHDNGNGTATISGTPSERSGLCNINTPTDCAIVATNGSQTVAQHWVAEFEYPPDPTLIATATTFVAGRPNSFTVATTGGLAFIPKGFAFDSQGASWLTFHDNGDGTGVLSGTPPAGASATQKIVLIPYSKDGAAILETPNFNITVIDPVQFVTPNQFDVTVGQAFADLIGTNQELGVISEIGALPKGIGFAPTGLGAAYVLGEPAVGTGGAYTLQLSVINPVTGLSGTQAADLRVHEGPAFTSAPTANFYAGQSNTFAVTVSGYPLLSSAPAAQSQTAPNYIAGMEFTVTGLPPDLTYSNLNPEGYNTGTLILSGTPSSSDVGRHEVTISANNGEGVPVTQTFILNIGGAPGDVNGDGATTCVDFTAVRASFGKYRGQSGYNPTVDVNNDGVVDIKDLAIVAKNVSGGTACH